MSDITPRFVLSVVVGAESPFQGPSLCTLKHTWLVLLALKKELPETESHQCLDPAEGVCGSTRSEAATAQQGQLQWPSVSAEES